MAFIVRPNHRDDDAVLVSTLATVRGENLNALVFPEQIRDLLDLLTVQRDDTDLVVRDAAASQRFGDLLNEDSFGRVLHEIAHARICSWHGIRVDKDRLAAVRVL